jgi:hypothetical protein
MTVQGQSRDEAGAQADVSVTSARSLAPPSTAMGPINFTEAAYEKSVPGDDGGEQEYARYHYDMGVPRSLCNVLLA